jgi:Protein of unknown function (DUF4256)
MAAAMGIELLTEEQYRELQKLGDFDTKTSSWVKTPSDIRKLGGAIFCDRRYDTVFVYHNGAESYDAARAFRGSLRSKFAYRHIKPSMPIKDGFHSPSGKLPVANARVNNLQNVSEGSKVLVVGCCSAIGVNPKQGSVSTQAEAQVARHADSDVLTISRQ